MTTRRDFLRQTALLGAGLSISPFFIKAGSAGVGYVFHSIGISCMKGCLVSEEKSDFKQEKGINTNCINLRISGILTV